MDCRHSAHDRVVTMMLIGLWCLASPSEGWSLDATQPIPMERRENISLADAAIRALQNNLDISISRYAKEGRLADIVVEQAKFDPTVGVNGQFARNVDPLNQPLFGGTGPNLNQITIFDQRHQSLAIDATKNLLTGGMLDVKYNPVRNNYNQAVSQGFLFNPEWAGGLTFTLTQPLLKNAGIALNKTFIKVAQNNAEVEQHVF